MGLCTSVVQSSLTADELPTAKIVTPAGGLLRYSLAVTAADALLSLDPSGDVFLCSSDALAFDKPAPALCGTERLQLGQVYFALPRSMMRRPMAPAEMGALAARAAAALSSDNTEENLPNLRRGLKKTKFCPKKICPVAESGGNVIEFEKATKYGDVRSRQRKMLPPPYGTKLSIIYEGQY